MFSDGSNSCYSDETKETYQWILECLLCATNDLAPCVIFTDSDTGMVAAIHGTLQQQNIIIYLEHVLGVDVTSWALCFTHQSFNAGIQSIQHV
ncbi:15274_t:CDS:2, partial [Entrophospora sp. SA101]